jgi:hypothetical protein
MPILPWGATMLGVHLIQKTPDFIGPKQPLNPDRPWRVVAGPARFWVGRVWAQPVWKLKKSKRDENDILEFGPKLESACVWAPKAALDE